MHRSRNASILIELISPTIRCIPNPFIGRPVDRQHKSQREYGAAGNFRNGSEKGARGRQVGGNNLFLLRCEITHHDKRRRQLGCAIAARTGRESFFRPLFLFLLSLALPRQADSSITCRMHLSVLYRVSIL